MRKEYIEPSIKAIKIKTPLLYAISGEEAKTEFGPGTGEQPGEGTPVINSFGADFDEE